MKIIIPIILAIGLSACTRNTYVQPSPSNTTVIEFRANGNASFSRIRYSDPVDGLTLVNTILPYSISINTDATTLFLSIEVTPIQYPPSVLVPFMQAQIFADGKLFREASSSDFSLSTISASGTWRK